MMTMMNRTARKLFSTLERAHRLSRREKKICRLLITIYGLNGKGGPASSPAVIFFRPSFWEIFQHDARDGRDGLDPRELSALAAKIFATGKPRGPSPQGKRPAARGLKKIALPL